MPNTLASPAASAPVGRLGLAVTDVRTAEPAAVCSCTCCYGFFNDDE